MQNSNQKIVFPNPSFYSKKTLRKYAWLDKVITNLYPFFFQESEVIRSEVKVDGLNTETLMKYMGLVTEPVEEKVSMKLPGEFAIAFDGWGSQQTHDVCVFEVFSSKESSSSAKFLLVFLPFEKKECLDSASRKDFLQFVLSIFKKSLENVVCLIKGNRAANKAVADLFPTLLVGCYSRRFNLATEDILGDHDDVVKSVYRIMVKQKNLILAT